MARHLVSSKLAKKEIAELAEQIINNSPLVPSGGYFVTFTVTEPKYHVIKLFVKAENRLLAARKALEYDEARAFCETHPNAHIAICGAGKQREARAEGIVMIVNDRLGEK